MDEILNYVLVLLGLCLFHNTHTERIQRELTRLCAAINVLCLKGPYAAQNSSLPALGIS